MQHIAKDFAIMCDMISLDEIKNKSEEEVFQYILTMQNKIEDLSYQLNLAKIHRFGNRADKACLMKPLSQIMLKKSEKQKPLLAFLVFSEKNLAERCAVYSYKHGVNHKEKKEKVKC